MYNCFREVPSKGFDRNAHGPNGKIMADEKPRTWFGKLPPFFEERSLWTAVAAVVLFFIVVPLSVWWGTYAGAASQAPWRLLLGVSLTFIVGCLAGFFFTRAKLSAWLDGGFWTANSTSLFFFFIVVPVSVFWWRYAARTSQIPGQLLVGVSTACFMIGCLTGFVFTSYGEETGTIGKVRDWVIGGLTGLTLAQATQGGGFFKGFLAKFTVKDNADGNQFALVMSMAIVYFSLGFLFMFFQRELGWNVRLARSRAERGILDGSRQTTLAIQKLLVQLPPDILTGVQDINQTDVSDKAKDDLKRTVYGDDVNTFLKQAEEAVKSGAGLGWEDVYKVANIQYYRAYFETGDQHVAQVKKALDWITRALTLNPLHADLTMKYADMLDGDRQKHAAVAVLENLAVRPEAPTVTFQWLGYYLRGETDRLDDSINYSNKFLALFPGDNDARFNQAYAYLAKHCKGIKSQPQDVDKGSEYRTKGLDLLAAALDVDPDFKDEIAKWPNHPELKCMDDDEGFRKLAPKPQPMTAS